MPQKIFLWTAPRCVSTAFERSVMEIKDSKVFHEPFSKSYHFGPERQSPRYQHQATDSTVSYKEIQKTLTKEYDGVDVIFSKDMAYAIDNHFDILLSKEFHDFQHTFLIRNPRKSIPSLYNASINKALTGWDYFDSTEAGFKQMYELYKFIQVELDINPVVIDADDLLMDPEKTMKAYCEATGVSFDPNMLTWKAGHCPDWEVWNGWHDNVLKSSGFKKHEEEVVRKDPDVSKYPLEVRSCIKDNIPCYTFLASNKLNPFS